MEFYHYDPEVREKLGGIYDHVMDAVNRYIITKAVMMDLADALHPYVGGGHRRRMDAGGVSDEREMKQVFSDWYCRRRA